MCVLYTFTYSVYLGKYIFNLDGEILGSSTSRHVQATVWQMVNLFPLLSNNASWRSVSDDALQCSNLPKSTLVSWVLYNSLNIAVIESTIIMKYG